MCPRTWKSTLAGRHLGVMVDVSDLTAVEAAMRETEAALGPISHLVHAAAVGSGKFGFPFTQSDAG